VVCSERVGPRPACLKEYHSNTQRSITHQYAISKQFDTILLLLYSSTTKMRQEIRCNCNHCRNAARRPNTVEVEIYFNLNLKMRYNYLVTSTSTCQAWGHWRVSALTGPSNGQNWANFQLFSIVTRTSYSAGAFEADMSHMIIHSRRTACALVTCKCGSKWGPKKTKKGKNEPRIRV
jgi:hypothetical protein